MITIKLSEREAKDLLDIIDIAIKATGVSKIKECTSALNTLYLAVEDYNKSLNSVKKEESVS